MKMSDLPGLSPKDDQSTVYLADFLAALLVWGGLGWIADQWLGTFPVIFIIGMVVGNSAGLYLLYLRATKSEPTSTATTSSDSDA